ncbi:MAG: SHOCT domain-containing protein, partial [Pseudomonadota bacterium]|nr:SHOCT domain-containing protein [Pseudomonadota bacterium]
MSATATNSSDPAGDPSSLDAQLLTSRRDLETLRARLAAGELSQAEFDADTQRLCAGVLQQAAIEPRPRARPRRQTVGIAVALLALVTGSAWVAMRSTTSTPSPAAP